jgi:putative hydrolase of the HAD superfamily
MAEVILADYRAAIAASHAVSRNAGIDFPEVDIIKVWRAVIRQAVIQGLIKTPPEPDYRRLAFIFELLHNPVFPMPGFQTLVYRLKNTYKLGIISNAQFYTPVILHYFLHNNLPQTVGLPPFEPDLCFYSFELGLGKPGPALYEQAAAALSAKGISPEEVLYTGNDMQKDIVPAARAGFKTALFAGDKRSLRLRQDDPACRNTEPDRIITGLDQLAAVLDLPA